METLEQKDPRMRGRTPEPPYAWVDKRALHAIRAEFDGDSRLPIALSTYHALAEIASDESSASFETLILHIAQKAGLSGKSIQRVLPALEEICVVSIRRTLNGGKGPSCYTLLSMDDGTASPKDRTASPRDGTGTKTASSPAVEVKEIKREEGKATTATADSEWFESLKHKECYRSIDVAAELEKMQAWCQVNGKQPTQRRFINWLNRCDRPLDISAESGLPKQVYPKTGQELIRMAQADVKRIKADDANWDRTLAKSTRESIEWLEVNKPEGWQEKKRAMETNPKNFVRSQLKMEFQEQVRKLEERISQINARIKTW